ncbi:MAG: rod shape-determining protein RodA [Bacteroides sp.]|nr:rod shape-determining protein RodA [Bacteroides sp.]MBD5277458.1 rod shape-determining protein RodA [Bacteroides sp.]
MLPQERNSLARTLRNVDWLTVAIYLLMVVAGAISIYAASYDFDEASIFSFDEFSGKQLRWIGLSMALAFVLLLVDARMYETYAYPIYLFMLVLLAITPFVAPDIKGSHSWIVLGPVSLQPAEFAKFATALALAKLFSGYHFSLNAKVSNYARAISIIIVPVVLILAQNETGSALTFMALFFVLYREGMSGLILFAALLSVVIFVVVAKFADTSVLGVPAGEFSVLVISEIMLAVMAVVYSKRFEILRNLVLWFAGTGLLIWLLAGPCGVQVPGMPVMLGVIGVAAVYVAVESVRCRVPAVLIAVGAAVYAIVFMFCVHVAFDHLQPHQQMRIKVVLGIEQDLRGAGYNVNQSKIAIGSGGLTGKGFLNGTQTKLKYVPEQHTDFIFCTIGEEEGFVGSVAVTALFLALILRTLSIAERQPSTFSRVYAYCVASYFIFHFCINIGMVIGLCPVIGIPLPFFSYGGSSLWGFTILLFIMLRLDAARRGRG